MSFLYFLKFYFMFYLFIEFWHYQECSPSLDLLTLDNISKDMISNIQHILALGSNQLGQHLTVSSAVHRVLLHIVRLAHIIVPDTQLPSGLVHSPQDCSLVEEQRLSSVNKCVVKVRLPGLS